MITMDARERRGQQLNRAPVDTDGRDVISQVRVAVVITTIGRPELLSHLLTSLAAQTLPPCQVIVVDQSRDDGTRTVVDVWADRLPVRRLTSNRGASVGRNVGLGALADYDFVAFPDDDSRYKPDTLANAAEALVRGSSIGAVSGRLLDLTGRPVQLTFGGRRMLLDSRTVWTSAIEETCFFRAEFIKTVGTFDEELGIGAASPWQSGEGTDLLLRGLKAGWKLVFDPRIVVYEHNPGDPDPRDRAFRLKARYAARGTGHVFRRHHGFSRQFKVVFRPLGAAILSAACGRWAQARWYLQRSIGRVEGIAGRVLPGSW
jgi:glycosyltransferase involved in cell wall biosynthesis